MALHNDEPVLYDQLDRTALVREIGDAIATCKPPQVFGLNGDWGSGKTSFLHQVHYYLAGECPEQSEAQEKKVNSEDHLPVSDKKDRVSVVWFEAWRYQNEPVPVVALLHEIRSQMAWQIRALRRVGKTASVAIRGALLSMEDLTKKIGFQASKIQEAGEKWEEEHLAATLPSNTIREQLEAAMGGLLSPGTSPKKDRRVVVLIDDLDRCQPEAAYRLLEGLKIYLTLPNCVFVLGMNQRIVEEAIAQQVPVPQDSEGTRTERAAAYLDKLCQNVWRVPRVRDPKRFLLEMLPGSPVRQLIDRALGELQCLPPNPRRIKGFANLLQRFQARLPQRPSDVEDDDVLREVKLMLIVAYVYQFHHHLFRLWEANLEVYEQLLSWARGRPIELTGAETELEKEEERRLLLSQILRRLGRAEWIKVDEKSPVETFTRASAFPDPADANVFWIQRLLHTVAKEHEPEPQDFARYLRGTDEESPGEHT